MLEERKQRNLTVRCVSDACDLLAMPLSRFAEVLKSSKQLNESVRRAAEMRTNTRIRKVVEAAASASDLEVVTLKPGEVIFAQGSRDENFYLVEEGEVEMTLTPSLASDESEGGGGDGTPIPVRRYRAGECFGASGLLKGDSLKRNTATAVTAVTIKVIPHSHFRLMLRDDAFLAAGLKASNVLRAKRESRKGVPAGEPGEAGDSSYMHDEVVQRALRR